MTGEEDFQAALDAEPDNHHLRMIFGDWLEERGDPRGAGYRALGLLRRVPCGPSADNGDWNFHYVRWSHSDNLAQTFPRRGRDVRAAALPEDWCESMRRVRAADDGLSCAAVGAWNWLQGWCAYGHSRRHAEDLAARAFAHLPAERRASCLTRPVLDSRPG